MHKLFMRSKCLLPPTSSHVGIQNMDVYVLIARSGFMELTRSKQKDGLQENEHFLRMLDRGIDDMEAGRELPLEDAFIKITELRDKRRDARV